MNRKISFLGFIIIGVMMFGCGKEPPKPETPAQTKDLTLGAYYYPIAWNKNNLRQKLVPAQEPFMGSYDCRREPIIKQHLTWARDAGIDFFIMQWWGKGTYSDVTLKQNIAPYLTKEKSDMKFCVSYLTPYIHKTLNFETILDRRAEGEMLANLVYVGQNYFNHPNYLKINNKPVVFMYLSRLLKTEGDYAKIFNRIRMVLKEKTKQDIYLVGDEVFWTEPDYARIAQFDAITVYNMYGPDKYSGYAGESGFLKDMDEAFARYSKIARDLNKAFIPNVMPGFNDRGVPDEGKIGLQQQHYIIPRGFSLANKDEGALYKEYFKLAKKYASPELNIIAITSWNGWKEDTQIEPIKESKASSRHPNEMTNGYEYEPYGNKYLELTRSEKAAVKIK